MFCGSKKKKKKAKNKKVPQNPKKKRTPKDSCLQMSTTFVCREM